MFLKSRDKEDIISVIAYDQLRYLKNKNTFKYEGITVSTAIKDIANEFSLKVGDIEDSLYIIPSRVERNSSLFDIIQVGIDLTFENKGTKFILFDDVGSLCLKNITSLVLDILIDKESALDFRYYSSIDDNTYNRIKLIYNNGQDEIGDVYLEEDNSNIKEWGVLQFIDRLEEGENSQAKCLNLLNLYNEKTRKLSISKAFGDIRVRAGYSLFIKLNLGEINVSNYMVVEQCVHTFSKDEHFMDLILKGGIINDV